jgi:hypothetical protein
MRDIREDIDSQQMDADVYATMDPDADAEEKGEAPSMPDGWRTSLSEASRAIAATTEHSYKK